MVVPSVRITNDVLAHIAALAALEVDGVAGLGGTRLSELWGGASDHRGVTVEVREQQISVVLNLVVRYGIRIPDVAAQVQQHVKSQLELMTGLKVASVDIHIQSVVDAGDSQAVNSIHSS